MAVTNPEAIAFCDEKVRVAADRLSQAYYFAKEALDEWNANNYGGTILPIGGGTIRDGASPEDDSGTGGDGRKVIAANDVHNLINRVSELVTDYEASASAKLNTILNVSVNNTK